MLRVAAWTGGLFALGAGVVELFPGAWTEPLVLAVLGATLILVGGRKVAAQRNASPRPAPELGGAERVAR